MPLFPCSRLSLAVVRVKKRVRNKKRGEGEMKISVMCLLRWGNRVETESAVMNRVVSTVSVSNNTASAFIVGAKSVNKPARSSLNIGWGFECE